MPIQTYLAMLGRCPLASREYAALKNSVIEHGPLRNWSTVHILSSGEDAMLVLERAYLFYPDAAPFIEKALHAAESSKHQQCSKAEEDPWHFCSSCSNRPIPEFLSASEHATKSSEAKIRRDY